MGSKNQKSILLVEDEALIAMSEKMELEKYGYTVTMAHSSDEAIKVYHKNNDIDLILMDINLGHGLDGVETSDIILNERFCPIVFLSSHTEPDIVKKTEKVTSYGYVVKNAGITVLDASIKMAFKLFEATEALTISEIRYRRLFEAAKDGILILDAKTGKIIDVNSFLINLLGYSKEQFIEKAIWDIGFFKDIIGNKDKFEELQQKEYVRYENLPLETAAGKISDVEFISNVYDSGSEKVIQCNIRSITERKLFELERKIASVKTEALLADKELILKEVHHRIRNNMNTIKSLFILQARTLKDPILIAALKDAERLVQSMMILYDKLYQSVSFDTLSIRNYLSSLVDETVKNFPNSVSVKIKKKFDEIILDAKRLQPLGIIINELLTNIMKYAFSGRDDELITISAVLYDNRVSLEIADNGKGMPEAVDFENSSGFGLKLVGMLTKQLDGTIRIERENGTRIVLEFPKDVQ